MSDHTPGPWEQHGALVWAPGAHSNVGAAGEPRPESSLVEYVPVSMGSPDSDEAYANARLMATAPDLLEALETLLEKSWSEAKGIPWQPTMQAIEGARAAIDKARGRG